MLTPQPDRTEIGRALALICKPGEVYELRAPGTTKATVSGYYNDLDALAESAVRVSALDYSKPKEF